MAIDLGDTPTGTAPTDAQKLQIRSSIGVVDRLTRGIEYLSYWHGKLLARTGGKILCAGDSTTVGNNVAAAEDLPNAILGRIAVNRGHVLVTTVNDGHSGVDTEQYRNTYLAAALAQDPDLIVIRLGINDPAHSRTVAQAAESLKQMLITIRAAKTVAQQSVIVMMPTSVYYPTGNLDQTYFKALLPLIRAHAETYEAAFVDTFNFFPDAQRGDDWLDTDLIHPDGRGMHWLSSLIADLVFPPSLSPGDRDGTNLTGWGSFAKLPLRAKIRGGMVLLSGIRGGNAVTNASVGTLPAGFWPVGRDVYVTAHGNAGVVGVKIAVNGIISVVQNAAGATAWLSLDGICFSIEQ